MEFKDYYKIMGVSEKAAQADIKRTYRKLARKYHPDVSKEANAEERFKELGEAYEVLKDPEKRKEYDQLRAGGWQQGQTFTPPPEWGTQGQSRRTNYTGADPSAFSDFFNTIFGRARPEQARYYSQGLRMRGEDQQYSISIALEEAFHGATRTIRLTSPHLTASSQVVQTTRSLNVKIPKGVTDGQLIRLQGQGSPSLTGGESGDLYLKVEIAAHPYFNLDGSNILLNLPITPWEAALGATITVPTLAGKVQVKIPKNSQAGQKLRLAGRGLPGKPSGDQYMTLQIKIPKVESEKAKQLYKEMAEIMTFNPRETLGV